MLKRNGYWCKRIFFVDSNVLWGTLVEVPLIYKHSFIMQSVFLQGIHRILDGTPWEKKQPECLRYLRIP